MLRRRVNPSVLAVLLAATTSCSLDPNAHFIIWTEVLATSDSLTEVGIWFESCGGEFSDQSFNLSAGDHFFASASGQSRELERVEDPRYEFFTTFDFAEEGTEFRVSYEPAHSVGRPDGFATLPASFDLLSPTVARAALSDEIPVEWSPSGTSDMIYLRLTDPEVEDACIYPDYLPLSSPDTRGPIEDTGQHTIPADALGFLSPSTQECQALLTVDRFRATDTCGGGFSMYVAQRRTHAMLLTR
jgi:hypothetical protein